MSRNYTNVAPPIALTVAATIGATTLTVASTAGYPEPPFLIGLERGTANEEVALCTVKTATTFTVTRGYDGTTARTHSIGTSLEHTVAAIDYREIAEHIAAIMAHGVEVVVGTSEVQVLTSKSMDGGTNTFTNIPSGAISPLPASKITSGTFDIARIPAIPWTTGLSSVPATFPPSAHQHPASDINTPINASTINGRTFYVQDTAPISGLGINGDVCLEF